VRIGGSGRSPAAGPANVADMRLSYGAGGQSLDESDVSSQGVLLRRFEVCCGGRGWMGAGSRARAWMSRM